MSLREAVAAKKAAVSSATHDGGALDDALKAVGPAQLIGADQRALAWLQEHPALVGLHDEESVMLASYLPAWLEDESLARSLMSSKLVRISSPFPAQVAAALSGQLADLPDDVWTSHRGATKGFQFSHHNIYFDHAHLASHTPAYHAACKWLQTVGRDWFERVTGRRGTVDVSASWYRPGDYSTPHNDFGRRRHIAFIWHLLPGGEWDECCGGDLVWCEPYFRFRPVHNCLYLFRVHDASMHFVQPVVAEASLDRQHAGSASKRLAVNGWFVLEPSADEQEARTAEPEAGVGALATLTEELLSEEGVALHRQLLGQLGRDEEASFVHDV
jgi:hypothetical protein